MLTTMRRFYLSAIIFGLLLAVIGAQPVSANWGGEAGGRVAAGAFKPIGAGQVEMLKEDLHIRLYRDRAKVEVDYVLHNTGEELP